MDINYFLYASSANIQIYFDRVLISLSLIFFTGKYCEYKLISCYPFLVGVVEITNSL